MEPLGREEGGENVRWGSQATSTSLQSLLKVQFHPAALAAPGSLLEMQSLRPTPEPLNQSLHFNKIPRSSVCTAKV